MAATKSTDWTTPEGLAILKGWALDGLIDEQIAHNMGIARQTLSGWKKKHPDIGDALKKGKEVVDREVENALHQSAMGHWVEETETNIIIDQHGEKKQRVKKVKKWIAANTTAQIFWLKNRKPEMWRDKRETNITSTIDNEERTLDIEKYFLTDTAAELQAGEDNDTADQA